MSREGRHESSSRERPEGWEGGRTTGLPGSSSSSSPGLPGPTLALAFAASELRAAVAVAVRTSESEEAELLARGVVGVGSRAGVEEGVASAIF